MRGTMPMADIMSHISLARYAESRQNLSVPRPSRPIIAYSQFMPATTLSVTM